ncbi:hypothetical protein, partial [Actinokineospora sp.]|uniref:hypothetical protein n=1 Tax=Actinokineospora sp. TaxID=1872133 RepID=UPI003D6B673D
MGTSSERLVLKLGQELAGLARVGLGGKVGEHGDVAVGAVDRGEVFEGFGEGLLRDRSAVQDARAVDGVGVGLLGLVIEPHDVVGENDDLLAQRGATSAAFEGGHPTSPVPPQLGQVFSARRPADTLPVP